ncbi:hypothetical protein ACOI1H_14565 [Loktanella sp. DJP18]|uniref:hypothetical protein n=1 Tax=Loktanella sp. DJP18 TaxID=3409788 RepID=UPI003BB68FD4
MVDKNRAQIPIIKDQAEEAIRRIELNLRVLEEQVSVAQGFLEEEVRSENKNIAYELQILGVDMIERVNIAPDQKLLNRELKEILEQVKNKRAQDPKDVDELDGFFTT